MTFPLNIHEQILLEEEEIRNLTELDSKLKTIYYTPGKFMKFLKYLLSIAGGAGGFLYGEEELWKLIGSNGSPVAKNILGGFGAIAGLLSGVGVYYLLKFINKRFATNIVNSKYIPTEEKLSLERY